MADFPTKQDLQDMASSIVHALSKELHELRKQVDTVGERMTDIESASTSTVTWLTALEADQQAFRCHLTDVQLW